MPGIEPNSFVTVAYVLKGDDGAILDSSREEGGEPIEYVHGYGMLVPGLEAALAGMSPGDKKDIAITAEEGFGERDEELVLEIDRAEVPNPKEVAIGDELVAESPDGDEVVMRVVEVKKDSVVVDANHPLAGLALHYSVEICTVRAATAEEIEDAAADLDEAHEHVHGADCDHSHEHGHELLGLGGKPKTPSGPRIEEHIMSNQKTINSWDWDIRVRERLLKNGTLAEKDVEKHSKDLVDVAENCDAVSLAQPALGGREG